MQLSTLAAAVGGALTVALFGAPMVAQAASQTETWTDWDGLSDFSGADPSAWTGITIGDKTIIYVGAGNGVEIQGGTVDPSGQAFTDDWDQTNDELEVTFEDFPPNRIHQTTVNPVSGSFELTPSETVALQYIINIDDSTFPADPTEFTFAFGSLSIDANNPAGGPTTFSVTKRVQGLTPTGALPGGTPWDLNNNFDIGEIFDSTTDPASAGDVAQDTVFCGTCTTWLVTDYVEVFANHTSGDNILGDITNSFTQTIPTPGALALIATGLLGLGFARRRAAQKA
jgi:hypothetical protein